MLVPSGTFLTAPFNITSHLTIRIMKSGVLLASPDEKDWPVVEPLPSYGHGREMEGPRYGAFIGCVGCEDIGIVGEGTVDGQGAVWWEMKRQHKLLHTRGHLVEFAFCKGILLQGVKFTMSPFWTIHPFACDDVRIIDAIVDNPVGSPNTDGIDPDSSTNVLISGCTIGAGDDHIAVKSGMDFLGRKFGRPSANITVENTNFLHGLGFAIGSEMSGGVFNVTLRKSSFRLSSNVFRVKTGRGRGGIVENVFVDNVVFDSGVESPVHVNMYYVDGPPTNATATPILRKVSLTNMQGVALWGGDFRCLPESPCTSFYMENVRFTAPVGYTCECISGLSKNVKPATCFNTTQSRSD